MGTGLNLFVFGKKTAYAESVFFLTLWLVGKCPNDLKTIVPKALKRRFMCPNFVPIQC